jgi:hypothetical protein
MAYGVAYDRESRHEGSPFAARRDLDHVYLVLELGDDLADDAVVAQKVYLHTGNGAILGGAHGKRLDIIAPPRDEADYTRQHAGLVFDEAVETMEFFFHLRRHIAVSE